MHDLFQRPFTDGSDERVDVIRHNHEFAELVALSIEVPERLFHKTRDDRLPQPTLAVAAIEPLFETRGKPFVKIPAQLL